MTRRYPVLPPTAPVPAPDDLGLHWSDVDLDARRLVVAAALQRVRGEGLRLVETETALQSRRAGLLDAAAAAMDRALGHPEHEATQGS